MNLYDILGVAEDASSAEIKAAYRHRAREVHPDAGGSEGAMQELNDAYTILINPEFRASYDAGDDPLDGKMFQPDLEAHQVIFNTVHKLLAHDISKGKDPLTTDLAERLRVEITALGDTASQIAKIEEQNKLLAKIQSKFKQGEAKPVTHDSIKAAIQMNDAAILEAQRRSTACKVALHMLTGLTFDKDDIDPWTNSGFSVRY